jgi:hypothetical protein
MDCPAQMIYISLPVHTQPLVIADQLKNFSTFLPGSTVVLHVSAQARFTLSELEHAIQRSRCGNVLVNPERLETSWGNILMAHASNIFFIRHRNNASKVCLHASNDMLVRKGLPAWLQAKSNVFNYRAIHPGTYWRFGKAALQDECLGQVCKKLGSTRLVGSQIEGSCYDADLIHEVAKLVKSHAGILPRTPYPREEVWLSTIASALHVEPDGAPYIFSEFHRFDRVFWKVLRHVNPVIGTQSRLSDLVRHTIEYCMIKSGFHHINTALIDWIARDAFEQLAPYEYLSDGNNDWRVFDRHGLFGVKRIPRRIDSALRSHIAALAASCDSHPAC